ncbi:hypothetical protein MJI98_23260, partial [Salmonella enterica subsp. enterica serovar Kentucky]|nr:hypothetical protein [Salmonella enterica subsp. enterica serovar Kentucky]
KYKGVNSFGHLLFDLRDDPQQLHPIHDEAIEARMINLLIRLIMSSSCQSHVQRRLPENKPVRAPPANRAL